MRQTLSDIAYTFGAGFQIRSQLMGGVTVRAYPLYVKQEDFSDITATAKHQFRDQYAREGYQLQKILQLRPTSTHTMAGDTIKLFSTWDRVVVMCWLSAYMRTGRAMTMFYAGTPITCTCIWCDKSRYMTSLLCWWLSRLSESGLCLIFCDKYARVASKLSDGVCCWQYEDR